MKTTSKQTVRTAAWIDKKLQKMAKKIGASEDKTIAEVMEEELWKVLPNRLKKAMNREREIEQNGAA